jgi:hypothetical protein
MPFKWPLQSPELNQILKKKTARSPTHNVKGYTALIEPSEFDWSEAKLSCYGRDSCAANVYHPRITIQNHPQPRER